MSFLDRFRRKPNGAAFQRASEIVNETIAISAEELAAMKADPLSYPADDIIVKLWVCRQMTREGMSRVVDRAAGAPIRYSDSMAIWWEEIREGMRKGMHPVLAALALAAKKHPDGRIPPTVDLAAALDVLELDLLSRIAEKDRVAAVTELWDEGRFEEADALVLSLAQRATESH